MSRNFTVSEFLAAIMLIIFLCCLFFGTRNTFTIIGAFAGRAYTAFEGGFNIGSNWRKQNEK